MKEIFVKKTKNTNGFCQSVYTSILSGNIDDELDGLDETVDTLIKAGKNDIVVLYIQSSGGSNCTAQTLKSLIESCKAPVITVASGICWSAATILWLSGDYKLFVDNTTWLFHSSGVSHSGYVNNTIKYAQAQKESCDDMMKSAYQGFLSDEQISYILDGCDDLWMTSSDMCKIYEDLDMANMSVDQVIEMIKNGF